MTFLQSILLGLIQGVAEFLPISSSGHLAIAQNLLNINAEVPAFYDVCLLYTSRLRRDAQTFQHR